MIDENVEPYLKSLQGRNQAILYGMETHVCIRQTTLDLMSMGYEVHLVVDAVSSMNHHDRNTGIEFLRDQGVAMVSFQALVFEMMRTAAHPQFKEVLNIVKQNPKEQLDLHYWKSDIAKL